MPSAQRTWAQVEVWALRRVPDELVARRRGAFVLRTVALFVVICLGWLPAEVLISGSRFLFVQATMLMGSIAALAVVVRAGRVAPAAHLLAGTVVVTVLLSARAQFGGAGLEVLSALVTVPLLMSFCGGWRLGLLWGGVSLAVIVTQAAMAAAGQAPPLVHRSADRDVLFAVTLAIVLLATTGLMVLFEFGHARTRGELEAALARAQAADRAKSQFLAMMSHELRTPMNGLLGMLGLVVQTTPDPDRRDLVQSAFRSAEELSGVLTDLVEYARMEAKPAHSLREPVDLQGIVEAVISRFAAQAKEKGISLRLVRPPRFPRLVRSDAQRLRLMLLHLVGNAVKFTHEGDVVVRLDGTVQGPDLRLVIAVEDSGVGIAPEDHERIFEPFTQVDTSTTRAYGGVGLGLALVKRLAVSLGGQVQVRSAPGVGSTFTFEAALPVLATAESSGELAPVVSSRGDAAPADAP